MLLASTIAVAPAYSQTQNQAPPGKGAFGPRVQKSKNPAGAKKPASEVIETFDAWKVECQKPRQPAEAPSGKSDNMAADAKRECAMVQTARNEKLPQIGLTLVLSRVTQGEQTLTQIRVLAPIGVFLPTGVALEIDGTAISRVPFSRCLPQVCMALGAASPETLEKMKKGSIANFIIYDGPGAGLPIKISLKGFGKALAKLDEL